MMSLKITYLAKGLIMVDHAQMKTTILLLVSDPIVCSVLKETLEREGYTAPVGGMV